MKGRSMSKKAIDSFHSNTHSEPFSIFSTPGMVHPVFSKIAVSIMVLFFLLFVRIDPAAPQDKSIPGKEDIPLHLVENSELIKTAITGLENASKSFLSHLRGVTRNELHFKATKEALGEIEIPDEEPPGTADMNPLDRAKTRLDHAKSRANELKELKDMLEVSRAGLSDYLAQLLAAQSAGHFLHKTYDKLKAYLLEIDMRIDDKTLKIEVVPNDLKEESIDASKQYITEKIHELDEKIVLAQHEQKLMAARMKEINKNIINAESQVIAFEDGYNNELQRRTIEKRLSSLAGDRLIDEFSILIKKYEGLKKQFDLSNKKFRNSKNKTEEIKKKTAALKAIDAEKVSLANTISRCEEAKQAMAAVGEIQNYQNRQLELLKELQPSVKQIINYASSLERESSALSEHLFSMYLISGTIMRRIQNGQLPSDSLKEYVPESLETLKNDMADMHSKLFTIKEQAKNEIVQIADRIRLLEPDRKEMERKFAYLEKIDAAVTDIEKWEAGLKDAPVEKIVEEFTRISDEFDEKRKTHESTRKEYEEKQTVFNEVKNQYESLKDPLFQKAKDEISGEKRHILKTLYGYAGITLPEERAEKTEVKKTDVKKDVRKNESTREKQLVDLEFYQNVISTQFELINHREKLKAELSDTLSKLDGNIGKYISDLIETYKMARQQAILALKLKMNRKEIAKDQMPKNYAEIIKSDPAAAFEKEIIRLFNEILARQLSAQQLLMNMKRPDETLDSIEKLTAQVAGFVGNKFDILKVYQNIKTRTARKTGETMNETEQKAFDRQAMRRLSEDDSLAESLFGLLPSSHHESLIELMKAYYKELIDLEKKRKNIEEMRGKINQLVQLSQEEYDVLEKLVPLVKKHISSLEIRYAEQAARIRMRLNPKRAAYIMRWFEAENGYRFSIPTPVAEEKMVDFIKESAGRLLDLKAGIIARQKALEIFQKRLASAINEETSVYKGEMDILTVTDANIQRRIRFISGHSDEELKNYPPEEIPVNEVEKRRFLKGELGMLRIDRMKLHQQTWMKLIIKLIAIFILAVTGHWVAGRLVNTLRNRSEKQGKATSQTLVLYSLFHTVSKFGIWTGAIVLAMYSMSINVGAILTGLGIGGLAIAMASKETISNFLGGITILTNQPFKVGNIIKYDGQSAKVVDISLRYTKLRGIPTNFLIIVPNSHLSDVEVINVTESIETGIRINARIPLSVRNSYETVELGRQLIIDLIGARDDLKLMFVKLGSFSDYAITFEMRYRILGLKSPFGIHKVIDEVNMEITRQLKENGVEFAVKPHMILSGENDPGLPE